MGRQRWLLGCAEGRDVLDSLLKCLHASVILPHGVFPSEAQSLCALCCWGLDS